MWEYEIAKALKENTKCGKDKAISGATATVGIIEQLSPLVISAYGGAAMYEAEQLLTTQLFNSRLKQVGNQVLLIPVGSYTTVCVIDILGG